MSEWGQDLLPGLRVVTPTGKQGIITRPGGTPDANSWRVRFDGEEHEREWLACGLRLCQGDYPPGSMAAQSEELRGRWCEFIWSMREAMANELERLSWWVRP